MADIDVERKDKSKIWLWILGLLLLAMLAWLLLEVLDDDAEVVEEDLIVAPVAEPPVQAPMGVGMPAAVTMFLTQCTEQQGTPSGTMGLGHDFTTNCLEHLGEGISELVSGQQVEDANVSQQLAQYESTVQQLEQSDSMASTHSELTRNAATTAAALMQSVQSAWYSANQTASIAVGEVEDAAMGIDASTPMLEQRESVHTFFREAGEALQMLAQQPQSGTV